MAGLQTIIDTRTLLESQLYVRLPPYSSQYWLILNIPLVKDFKEPPTLHRQSFCVLIHDPSTLIYINQYESPVSLATQWIMTNHFFPSR